jgi:hypothetical protein
MAVIGLSIFVCITSFTTPPLPSVAACTSLEQRVSPAPHTAVMSAPDPKEAWARIQNELSRRSARFGGGGGGPPKGLFGGVGGLVLVVGGFWVANNALFNGASNLMRPLQALEELHDGAKLT